MVKLYLYFGHFSEQLLVKIENKMRVLKISFD